MNVTVLIENRMKSSKLVRCVRAWLWLGLIGVACGESTVTTSSETNWFQACVSSDDCRDGSCRCGVCTTTCEDDATCHSVDNGVCALGDSPGYAAQCGATAPGEGVCLPGCDSASTCGSGRECTDGVCVVAENPGSGGSSSTNGNNGGSAGGEGEPCPQNPRAQCAVDCSDGLYECGAVGSLFDEAGCVRLGCDDDADCGEGRRCFGIGPGDDPEVCGTLFRCTQEERGCVCGGGADCYPGYCVPR
jgi:hypothetical protein